MKKIFFIMLLGCAVLSFTACSRKTEDPASVSQTDAGVTQTETSTSQNGTTEAAAPPAETEAPGDTAEFKIITGEVTGVSDTLTDMTVNVDGKELKFDLAGVDIETSYALEPDTDVTVIYQGEISGTDTSNAKIVLVVDIQKEMEIQSVTGSVEDQAMSTFTLRLEDGKTVSFLKDNCEGLNSGVLGQASDDSNGSGAMVKVTYVTVKYDAGSESNFPLKVESAE